MALYRLEVQGIQRAHGRSVVAAAAYRAGAALYDERIAMTFDYSGRSGVAHTEIMAPEGTPPALLDRQILWNAAERADTRSDSRPAREILLALPHELDAEQRLALVRNFVADHVVAHGMIADIALHLPDNGGDQRNHHAHILLTTREITATGFGRKVEAWTRPDLVRHWRRGWARVQNDHLQRALGPEAPQVTDQSLKMQGIERDPTIHLGPAASGMERRGEGSDRGDINRAIEAAAGDRERLGRALADAEDAVAGKAPRAHRSTTALAEELAALHRELILEHRRLDQERAAIPIPAPVRRADAVRTIVGQARVELSAARRRLSQVERRVEGVRQRRSSLARWISNPGRMIWARHAELNALAGARAEVRLAAARVQVREAWLRSEAGQTYLAGLTQPTALTIQAHRRSRRTLERRMKRLAKRAELVEGVRVKTLIARELGHTTVAAPTRTVGVGQFVRSVDGIVLAAIAGHAREAQLQAYERVRSGGRRRDPSIDR